jgi:hypothetical protein
MAMEGQNGKSGYHVWQCKSAETCPGGSLDHTDRGGGCAEGREGVGCGRCKPGHKEVGERFGECVSCPEEGSDDDTRYTVSAVMFVVFCIALALVARAAKSEKFSEHAENTEFVESVGTSALIIFRYAVQVSIISDFDVKWPKINLHLFTWPKFFFVRLDLFHIVDLGCLARWTLARKMFVRWALPLMVAAVLLAAGVVNNMLSCSKKSCFERLTHLRPLYELLGRFYGMFFGAIVKQNLVLFECVKNPNGLFTLAEMPDVVCQGPEHYAVYYIGLIIFALYVGVYMILAVCVSTTASSKIMKGKKKFQFIYRPFRTDRYTWAPVVILKELLCASTIALFPGNGGSQIVLMSLVCSVYSITCAYYKPYPVSFENNLDTVVHAGIVVQTVFSLNFLQANLDAAGLMRDGIEEVEDTCNVATLLTKACPTHAKWLALLQVTFVVVPGLFCLGILLKCLGKLPKCLQARHERYIIQNLQLSMEPRKRLCQTGKDGPMHKLTVHDRLSSDGKRILSTNMQWDDGSKKVRTCLDDVEVSVLREFAEVLASRTPTQEERIAADAVVKDGDSETDTDVEEPPLTFKKRLSLHLSIKPPEKKKRPTRTNIASTWSTDMAASRASLDSSAGGTPLPLEGYGAEPLETPTDLPSDANTFSSSALSAGDVQKLQEELREATLRRAQAERKCAALELAAAEASAKCAAMQEVSSVVYI